MYFVLLIMISWENALKQSQLEHCNSKK